MKRGPLIAMSFVCGCSSDPVASPEAGVDASADVAQEAAPCVNDFPCANPFSCLDSTHWTEMKELPHAPCIGLICTSTGKYHACDPGLECIHQPAAGSAVACAYGGRDGCLPADAGAFTPKPIGAAPTKQAGACTTTSIDAYWTACLDPTTRDDTKCTTFSNANKTCSQCLAQTATVVDLGTQQFAWVPNVGGCYALLDGTSASGSCAALDDANMQCAIAVCKDVCSMFPDGLEACALGSRTSACKAFSICDGEAGASFATCEPTTAKDFVTSFGAALCGP
jgi:hypothetical protein